MARRTLVAVALCALAAAVIAAPALAHEGNPNFESLVRAITPRSRAFASTSSTATTVCTSTTAATRP